MAEATFLGEDHPLDISMPWAALSPEAIDALPAQLGVFETADAAGNILEIGYAGGRSTFGMRSALELASQRSEATQFRLEFTHAYLTRWEELLMIYHGVYGRLPVGNNDHNQPLGRLAKG